MKYGILILLIIITGLAGCEQEELPEPNANDPVFFLSGSIEGKSDSLKAGEAGYYLYTYFTSDSNNQYRLTGHFSPTGCKDCPESLKIELPAHKNSEGRLNLDEALQTGDHSFYNPSPVYEVKFNAIPKGPAPRSYMWDFGDSRSAKKKNITHYYPVDGPEDYQTALRINYNNGECIRTISKQVDLTDQKCRTNFTVNPINQTEVIFQSEVNNLDTPASYRWYTDSLLISKAKDPTYDFQDPGVYKVCLEAEGQSGCTANYCQRVDVFSKGCNGNFRYRVKGDTTWVDPAFVNITWRDENGTLYKTGRNQQPDESYFRILEAKPYENNENGEPTYKLKVEFDCRVYSSGSSKRLKDFKGFIAVAYPEPS